MRPRTKLKNLDVREISLVDRGANEHAKIVFMKRYEDERARLQKLLDTPSSKLSWSDRQDKWAEEDRISKEARYRELEARLRKYPWDDCARAELDEIYPAIDEAPKRISKMHIERHEVAPVMKAAERVNLANMTLDALAYQVRKANPHLTAAQSFEKAYKENPHLARMERNASYEAIGASYRIEEPVSKSATDGTTFNERVAELVKRGMPRNKAFDEVAKSLLTGARETTPRERAFREVAQAALPEMMSLKPRTLGDYATGSRSINQDLDTGWPSEKSIEELYNDMQRAGRDGRDFEKAAAAYMRAQARIEAAARSASGAR